MAGKMAKRWLRGGTTVVLIATFLALNFPSASTLHDGPNRAPAQFSIKATSSFEITAYDASTTDPDADTLTFVWTWTGTCGIFLPTVGVPTTERFANWDHSSPGCPHENIEFHPATVSVAVTDGTGHRLTAQYPEGSLPGTGPPSIELTPESSSESPTPVSSFCPVTDFTAPFEATQGVWQDDEVFVDSAEKQLTIIRPGWAFDQEIDMLTDRETLFFGQRGNRYMIPIDIVATGTKFVEADAVFTLVLNGRTDLYRVPIGNVPVGAPCGPPVSGHYEVDASMGVPPDRTWTFPDVGSRTYFLVDLHLETPRGRNLGPGHAELTGFVDQVVAPSILYVPASIDPLPSRADLPPGHPDALLNHAADSLLYQTESWMHYYWPVSGRVNAERILRGPALLNAAAQAEDAKVCQELARRNSGRLPDYCRQENVYAVRAGYLLTRIGWYSGHGRAVLVLEDADFRRLFPVLDPDREYVKAVVLTDKVVAVTTDADHWTVAHVLAHTMPKANWLGPERGASDCQQAYHLEVGKGNGFQIHPTRQRHERVMGIMGPPVATREYWIEQCTYKHLLDAFREGVDPPVVGVAGWVAQDETGLRAGNITSAATFDSISDLSAGAQGRYGIAFDDASGSRLARFGFDVAFELEGGVGRNIVPFGYRVEPPSGARSIILEDGSTELARRAISANAPTLEITRPKVDARVKAEAGQWTFEWAAHDRDGDALTFDVLYSPDGPERFVPLIIGTHETRFTLPQDGLEQGPAPLMKIVASDGYHGAVATSSFTFGTSATPAPPWTLIVASILTLAFSQWRRR